MNPNGDNLYTVEMRRTIRKGLKGGEWFTSTFDFVSYGANPAQAKRRAERKNPGWKSGDVTVCKKAA